MEKEMTNNELGKMIIGYVDKKLDQKINALEIRLIKYIDMRINEVVMITNAAFQRLEDKMNKRFEEMDKKIDLLHTMTNRRIDWIVDKIRDKV